MTIGFELVASLGNDQQAAEAVVENNDLPAKKMDVIKFVDSGEYHLVRLLDAEGDDGE